MWRWRWRSLLGGIAGLALVFVRHSVGMYWWGGVGVKADMILSTQSQRRQNQKKRRQAEQDKDARPDMDGMDDVWSRLLAPSRPTTRSRAAPLHLLCRFSRLWALRSRRLEWLAGPWMYRACCNPATLEPWAYCAYLHHDHSVHLRCWWPWTWPEKRRRPAAPSHPGADQLIVWSIYLPRYLYLSPITHYPSPITYTTCTSCPEGAGRPQANHTPPTRDVPRPRLQRGAALRTHVDG
jgi:hypothetical protein